MVTMMEMPTMAGRAAAIRSMAPSNVSNVQSTTLTGTPRSPSWRGEAGDPQRGEELLDRVLAPEVGVDERDPGEGRGIHGHPSPVKSMPYRASSGSCSASRGPSSRQNPAQQRSPVRSLPQNSLDGTGEETEGPVKVNRTPWIGVVQVDRRVVRVDRLPSRRGRGDAIAPDGRREPLGAQLVEEADRAPGSHRGTDHGPDVDAPSPHGAG